MPYEEDYGLHPATAMKAMEDKPSLTQELQRVHKCLAEYDDLLNLLSAKIEPFLVPSVPSVRDADKDVMDQTHESAMRHEIWILCSRASSMNRRFLDLITRFDS